jgi:hypothetical protein
MNLWRTSNNSSRKPQPLQRVMPGLLWAFMVIGMAVIKFWCRVIFCSPY